MSHIASELRHVADVLLGRWRTIAATTLAALLAALVYLSVATPTFQSSAHILIDPRAKRIVEGAVVPGGMGSSAVGADTLLIDSQVELMSSNAVLHKVVVAERLDADPEFQIKRGEGMRMKLRNSLGRWLTGGEPERLASADPIDLALYRLKDKHLRVRRLGNTYVISVAVISEDAAKAARLANAIAEAYLRDQVVSATDTTRAATGILEGRVTDLKKAVEQAEQAVEEYRTRNGLIGVPGLLVNEQQLQQQNDKLILARSQAALARVRYDQVRNLTPQSVALASQSDALKSPVVANLRSSLARIERREAVIQQTLRPGHPDYQSTRSERQAVMQLLADELDRIKGNARAESETADAAERMAERELKQLEARASSNNQALVRLRELSREAQSARTVYESFLNRAKETREQEQLPRENSRIISTAAVAPYPIYPPTIIVLAGALMLGGLLGSSIAWIGHLLNAPGPVARLAAQPAASPQPARRLSLRERLAAAAAAAPDRAVRATPDAPRPRPAPADPRAAAAPRRNLAGAIAEAEVVLREPGLTPAAAPRPLPRRTAASALTTLARLPLVRPRPRIVTVGARRWPAGEASGQATFADVIGALEDRSGAANAGFRSGIDTILGSLETLLATRRPVIALLGAVSPGAGTSTTALAVAYRAQLSGKRTLLVDAAAGDAELSSVFASSLADAGVLSLDRTAALAEIVVRDARTGLALLPLAFADLAALDARRIARLQSGLRRMAADYDLVVIDAGALTEPVAAALGQIATNLLIVNRSGTPEPDAILQATEGLGLPHGRVGMIETMAA